MPKKVLIEETEEWGGYTIEEMKYHRALAYTKKEIEKDRIRVRANILFTQTVSSGGIGNARLGKITGKMSVLDYILIGFRLSRKAVTIYKSIKKRFK